MAEAPALFEIPARPDLSALTPGAIVRVQHAHRQVWDPVALPAGHSSLHAGDWQDLSLHRYFVREASARPTYARAKLRSDPYSIPKDGQRAIWVSGHVPTLQVTEAAQIFFVTLRAHAGVFRGARDPSRMWRAEESSAAARSSKARMSPLASRNVTFNGRLRCMSSTLRSSRNPVPASRARTPDTVTVAPRRPCASRALVTFLAITSLVEIRESDS